ncbi:MAG TPA: hypothetical protein PKV52_04775, partial [Candidatus Saccharibacteria bacterium]|nr:hypothetical protein [Candidatus Saccharibacteria bacterium]
MIDADPSQGQDATDITKREYDVDVPEGLQKFFASEIIKKANVATSIISILDSVARINQSISDGSLITMVNMAKAAQAIGVFQVMTTARDQSKTGELTADEYGEFMKIINNATNNEGWQTVIEDSPTGSVRAETNGVFTAAKDKEEYCSEEHQAELHDPANAKAAESEHHYHCDDKKIGSATGAENITKWWNVFFKPFQPLLDAYMAIPLSNLVGFVNNIADSVTGPIISTAIKVVGLESTKDAILGYMTTRITSALGAGPMLDTFTPGGQIMNVMIEGSAASAESSARYQGGVATTALTMDYTNSLIAEYNNEKKYDSNIQKYLALSDPDSVLSKTLFNQVKDINTSDRANSVSQ